jgi:lipopolysaccharide export system protein LptC
MTNSSNENFETSLKARFKQPVDGYLAGVGKAIPRETLHQARRYSSFVRFMKRILPLAALVLAIAVIGYAVQPRDTGQMALTFERMGAIENDLAMINPRLTGTDDNGLPFVVTASSALQLGPESERVQLENVNADLVLEDGTELNVIAAQGVIDNQTQTLDFYGGIELTTGDGYTAETETARADLRQGIVHGESPIAARGAMGNLTAQSFAFERQSGMLHFFGDVRMDLNGAVE